MSKVNFIIAGVQKAGTELISYYLRQHSQISMPENELHYFDTSISKNDPNFERYHNNFKNLNTDKIFGEKTPIYIFYKDCMKKIASYNSNIKLILIFRDPFDRALSAYNMETIRGNENLTFDQAIKNENMRVKLSDENFRNFSYLNRGYYFKQLKNCYNLFKKEQILILNYENLVNNFQKTMLSIQNFIGCKKENYPSKPKRITWAKEKREIQYDLVTKKFFINALKDDYRNFKEETGIKFKNFENV